MAAIRPNAVASNASAIPGATTARLVVWASEMPIKEFMMPHTVPNNPTKGAVAPMVASTPVPRAIRRDIAASTRSSRSEGRGAPEVRNHAGPAPDPPRHRSFDPLQPQRDALLEAVIDNTVGQH